MELYVTSKEIKNAPSRGGVSLCSIVLEDTNIVLEDIIIVLEDTRETCGGQDI